MLEIGLGVILFTGAVMTLAGVVLAVRSQVVATGTVHLTINEKTPVAAKVGGHLLDALSAAGVTLPAGCGGKGTCGQCRVIVEEGGGAILPIEKARISERDARSGTRLACQVAVKQDIKVHVPDEAFGVEQWICRVRSNENLTPMIKELVLELPPDHRPVLPAGAYIQITAPAVEVRFLDFDIDAAYRSEWDRLDLWRHNTKPQREETRAYSLANHPDDNEVIVLNIRIAVPPPGADESVPPGIVSSYLFSLAPGETVSVSGPFGKPVLAESTSELVYIGGGVGMAPMRSKILDQVVRRQTKRTISFWYGARSASDLFYVNEFDALQADHDNFKWFVALSDAKPEDAWKGRTGYIHNVLYEDYLKDHPTPEECEFHICGPPVMLKAVLSMLDNLGVDPRNIFYDDFGA